MEPDSNEVVLVRNSSLESPSLSAFLAKMIDLTNDALEKLKNNPREDGGATIIAALIVATAALIATAVGAGVALSTAPGASVGERKKRKLKLTLIAFKWYMIVIRVGTQQIEFLGAPDVNVDLDLNVYMFNKDPRADIIQVEFLPLGDTADLEVFFDRFRDDPEGVKASFVTYSYLSRKDANIHIDYTKDYPKVMMSEETSSPTATWT